MRLQILDGFRGFFLIFMAVIHINIQTDVILGKLNHHYFGWVEDAQGFVFISGFVVGLVYGGKLLRRNFADMRRAVYQRALTIYSHQAGLILIMLFTALFLARFGLYPRFLSQYTEEPVGFSLASLMLIADSPHMGILPMYIWYMLLTPFVLMAIQRGWIAALILLCILSWTFAQTGLLERITDDINGILQSHGVMIDLGVFFDVFGWQVLFFVGLYFGFKKAEGSLNLDFLKEKQYYYTFWIGLIAFILFGVFDRIIFNDLVSTEYSEYFLSQNNREDFSLIYPVTFFLDLFLAVWLLVAGRSCGVRIVENLSRLVEWIFTRRFLVFLGQHSLHVFSFHILVVYFISIVQNGRDIAEFPGTIILIAGTASLYLPAWWHAKMQKSSRDKLQSVRNSA